MEQITELLKELIAELAQTQGGAKVPVYCTIRLLLRNFVEIARSEGISPDELQPNVDELVRCCRIMAGLSEEKETPEPADMSTANVALEAIRRVCSSLDIT